MRHFLFITLLLGVISAGANQASPSDKNATKETIRLYQNLFKLQSKGLLFGHQDALAYGHGWYGEEGRSDVKDVCGDYPAIYGWELGHLELGDAYSLDSVYFSDIQKWIKLTYERGGINTISWHLRNPLTGGSSWDISSQKVVASILPGGSKHDLFKTYLDKMAEFLLACKTDDGTYIPILFRPFHEHTGSWFWWGKNLCSVEDYISLWRFTVAYLQNEKGIHHLLYTYSSGAFKNTDEYLERYPGDDIIDILAFDTYDRYPNYLKDLKRCTGTVEALGKQKRKIAAVSETGGPIAKNTEWWAEVLAVLKPFEIAYVLVWRNPFTPTDHGDFAPSPGHPGEKDFLQFYSDPHTIFQKGISKEKVYH